LFFEIIEENFKIFLYVALKRAGFSQRSEEGNLLGGGVLGDSLGSLRNGVLGKFSGEKESDSGLDFSGRDG